MTISGVTPLFDRYRPLRFGPREVVTGRDEASNVLDDARLCRRDARRRKNQARRASNLA